MSKLIYKIKLLCYALWSLFFNFRYLPFRSAIKCPILLGFRTTLEGEFNSTSVKIEATPHFGMIRIGVDNGSFGLGGGRTLWRMKSGGKIIFKGKCFFRGGGQIVVNNGGEMIIGRNASFNARTLLNAGTRMVIGDDFLGGWDITILDGDGHEMREVSTERAINQYKPVTLGTHCWLSAHSTILKGVTLANDVTVPYGSIITKSCGESFCIFGGMPNKVLKHGVYRHES